MKTNEHVINGEREEVAVLTAGSGRGHSVGSVLVVRTRSKEKVSQPV